MGVYVNSQSKRRYGNMTVHEMNVTTGTGGVYTSYGYLNELIDLPIANASIYVVSPSIKLGGSQVINTKYIYVFFIRHHLTTGVYNSAASRNGFIAGNNRISFQHADDNAFVLGGFQSATINDTGGLRNGVGTYCDDTTGTTFDIFIVYSDLPTQCRRTGNTNWKKLSYVT